MLLNLGSGATCRLLIEKASQDQLRSWLKNILTARSLEGLFGPEDQASTDA